MVLPRPGLAALSDLKRGLGSLFLRLLFLRSRLAFRSFATGLTFGSSKTLLPWLSSIVTLAERTPGLGKHLKMSRSSIPTICSMFSIWLRSSYAAHRRLYPIAIFAGTVSLLLLQNRQNLPVFYYQAIVLLPIFALAWAGGLRTISTWLRPLLRGTFARRALLYIAMAGSNQHDSARSAFVPARQLAFAQ